MTGPSMLTAALDLAAAGWPVHPLTGKHPRTPNGFHDATLDPERIARWWGRWPSANIGIALPGSVLVIDTDPRNGGDVGLSKLTERYGELPDTLTAESGRRDGGRHHYYRRPAGDLTGRHLPQGVDLKLGGRGYVVAPPSVHPDTGWAYRWESFAPVADLPRWLVALLTVTRPTPRPPRPDAGDGEGLVRFVAGLQPGNRNNGLYWAARSAADDGTLDALRGALLDAAMAAGLSETEARGVLASAARGVAA